MEPAQVVWVSVMAGSYVFLFIVMVGMVRDDRNGNETDGRRT